MAKTSGEDTGSFEFGGRSVVMRRPTEGQTLVLTRVARLAEGDQEAKYDAVTLFGDVLESLFVQPADRRWAYQQLAERVLDASDYLELAVELIAHFGAAEAGTEDAPVRPAKRAARAVRR
jgi:hypothetical protein